MKHWRSQVTMMTVKYPGVVRHGSIPGLPLPGTTPPKASCRLPLLNTPATAHKAMTASGFYTSHPHHKNTMDIFTLPNNPKFLIGVTVNNNA